MVAITTFYMLLVANLASGAAVALPQNDSRLAFKTKSILANSRSMSDVNITKEVRMSLPKITGDNMSVLAEIRCLAPANTPDSEDCAALCDFVEASTESVTIGPLEEASIETGTCVLGYANLWPCGTVTFPQRELGPFCRNLLNECVLNGNDGIYEDRDDQNLAIALYGLESAPPYQEVPSDC